MLFIKIIHKLHKKHNAVYNTEEKENKKPNHLSTYHSQLSIINIYTESMYIVDDSMCAYT